MASGRVNRIKRPNTWLHRPMLQNVKKASCQPGAGSGCQAVQTGLSPICHRQRLRLPRSGKLKGPSGATRAKALGADFDRGTGTSMGPALAHAKYQLRTVNLTTMPSHQRAVACRKRW
jgi:hypothetical protein